MWNEEHFESIDQTERDYIRYYVGMIFATLVARKLYEMDYVCHFKRFCEKNNCQKMQNGKPVKGNKPEPDFIGMTYNAATLEYSTFEAKGGVKLLKKSLDIATRKQLWAVRRIDTQNPQNRLLFYSVSENYKNTRGVLKVVVSEPGIKNVSDYDVVPKKGKLVNTFRREISEIADELMTSSNKADLIENIGRITQEHRNGKLVLIIEYAANELVEIIIGDGNDIKIIHNRSSVSWVDSVTATVH